MSGGNQPPYRMPCEGVAGQQLFFLGSPFQHSIAPQLVDKYVNVTVVPNPAGGADIPPYERWTQDLSGGLSCEVHHCVTGVGAAPCSAWLQPYATNVFSHTGSTDMAVTRKRGFKNVQARRFWSGAFGFGNKETYDGVDNINSCSSSDGTRTSWRSAQAFDDIKYLQLVVSAEDKLTNYAYDGSGGLTTTTVIWDDTFAVTQTIDPTSGLRSYSNLSLSRNSDENQVFIDNVVSRAQWTWNEVVSSMTALTRRTIVPGSVEFYADTFVTLTDPDGNLLERAEWDLSTGTFVRHIYEYDSQVPPNKYLVETETFTITENSISYEAVVDTWASVGGPLWQSIARNEFSASGTMSNAAPFSDILADVKSLLALWPLNDDKLYKWRTDLKVSVAPLVSRDEVFTQNFVLSTDTLVKDYSTPITDFFGRTLGDVGWSDHTGLVLAQDPMTGTTTVVHGSSATAGDVLDEPVGVNPFSHTTDVVSRVMTGLLPPGCTYDSSTGRVTGTCTADCTWGITVEVTAALPAATGNILGAPKPAGYENYFDFGYMDWVGCCFRPPDNPGHQTWSWYQVGWGMAVGTFNSNAGCHLPLNATQWTNYFQAVNKPQGAFLFYNEPGTAFYGSGCVSSDAISGVLDGGALWAGKYAECLEIFPSQNFARPAGDDKFIFDENRVYCAVNASGSGAGSTWTLTDPITGLAPDDATDFTGTWGGPVVGGFYSVSGYSGGTLTLGAKIYNVPSNWASKSNGDDAFCFGKVRFPNCPGLLGAIGITPDGAGTTFTFAIAQPNFGMDSTTHQEQVDLWDATMSSVASNVTATRVDDSHFTTGSAYATAKYVTIHGAPKWYMNDTGPKGDYALLQWLSDFRSLGEYTRLTGTLDCSSSQVARPTTNAGGGPVTQPFASFSQTPGCLPFVPCGPKVVCISPNGETWPNGITYDFPDSFVGDEKYGSKWWAWVQSTMTDLFWQQPHRPCNIESCAKWQMDGGTCAEDVPGSCPGDDDYVPDESEPPQYFFGHAPQVEARLTVPANYGAGQDESAPALPAGIQIGWLSPVDYDTGEIALPPLPPGPLSDNGVPGGAATAWDLHALFCAHAAGCRFDYTLPGC